MADETAEETVTIPKVQFDLLSQVDALMKKVWNHGQHGAAARRLFKQAEPSLTIPEDIGDEIAKTRLTPIQEEVTGLKKTVEEFITSQREEKKSAEEKTAEAGLLDRLTKVKDKWRFTDEGMELVLNRLKEQKSADVEAAAAFIASEHAPPPQNEQQNGHFPMRADLFGAGMKSADEDVQQLHKDPLQWQENQFRQMMSELESAG